MRANFADPRSIPRTDDTSDSRRMAVARRMSLLQNTHILIGLTDKTTIVRAQLHIVVTVRALPTGPAPAIEIRLVIPVAAESRFLTDHAMLKWAFVEQRCVSLACGCISTRSILCTVWDL